MWRKKSLKISQYVSGIDVLLGIGFLTSTGVQDWRRGRIPYLEASIQANPNKISRAMQYFQQWADCCELKTERDGVFT